MTWKFLYKKDITMSRALSILLKPVISEKSTFGAERNEVTFSVALAASKPEIRLAVEKVFNVKVLSVTTSRLKGKKKRFRGKMGKRSDSKKAFVRLDKGESIDIGAGAVAK